MENPRFLSADFWEHSTPGISGKFQNFAAALSTLFQQLGMEKSGHQMTRSEDSWDLLHPKTLEKMYKLGKSNKYLQELKKSLIPALLPSPGSELGVPDVGITSSAPRYL